MELKDYITKGIDAAGGVAALAREIGMSHANLNSARHGRRGLPPVACGKLADLIGASRWDVVAASEILTEKDEAKRAYLLPFVLEIAQTATIKSARNATSSIL